MYSIYVYRLLIFINIVNNALKYYCIFFILLIRIIIIIFLMLPKLHVDYYVKTITLIENNGRNQAMQIRELRRIKYFKDILYI